MIWIHALLTVTTVVAAVVGLLDLRRGRTRGFWLMSAVCAVGFVQNGDWVSLVLALADAGFAVDMAERRSE